MLLPEHRQHTVIYFNIPEPSQVNQGVVQQREVYFCLGLCSFVLLHFSKIVLNHLENFNSPPNYCSLSVFLFPLLIASSPHYNIDNPVFRKIPQQSFISHIVCWHQTEKSPSLHFLGKPFVTTLSLRQQNSDQDISIVFYQWSCRIINKLRLYNLVERCQEM